MCWLLFRRVGKHSEEPSASSVAVGLSRDTELQEREKGRGRGEEEGGRRRGHFHGPRGWMTLMIASCRGGVSQQIDSA